MSNPFGILYRPTEAHFRVGRSETDTSTSIFTNKGMSCKDDCNDNRIDQQQQHRIGIFHVERKYILDKLLQVEVWHTDYQFVKHHTVLQVLRAIAYRIV